MAATRNSQFDDTFYQKADAFFPANHQVGLTYDDITLATLYSEVLPRDTQLDTQLTEGLSLNIPVISADMDTVTESRMAIAMALNGGLGLIHYNMPEKQQLSEVSGRQSQPLSMAGQAGRSKSQCTTVSRLSTLRT